LVSRQHLFVFSEALICLSYSGSAFARYALRRDDKWLAEPKLGERRLVVPASKHFRAGTSLPVISQGLAAVGKHLLSYETISSCGFEPKRRDGRNTRFTFAEGRIRLTRFGL